MLKRTILTKIFVLVVFALSIAPAVTYGYSYWNNLSENSSETISIGEWWGIAITTPQEFYDFATKSDSLSTDTYYLANNLDFTGFNWSITYSNNNVTFRGILDGNGYSINNLTITSNPSYKTYLGIFPRMYGGTVTNLTLSNVNLVLDISTLSSTSTMSGLITGDAYGSTNTIDGITIMDCGIRGTSSNGTGGLIGMVEQSSTIVNISNVKATGLRVFSTNATAGGLVGYVRTSGASVNVSDIDIEGEVSAMGSSSYTGGIIGRIRSGASFNLDRAIVDMTSQNTLETDSNYYLDYSERYMGGFIGYNQSTSSLVSINNAFFTGNLITNTSRQYTYIGTAIGRSSGSQTINNAFYSMVEFNSKNGTYIYDLNFTPSGVMATLVNASTMPSTTWWNAFAITFNSQSSLWTQNVSTGRLELLR